MPLSSRKFLLLIVGALVLGSAVVFFAGEARADTIGGPSNINCPGNDCFGAAYTLQYIPVPDSSTATTQTFDVILTLDTSGTK